MRDPKSARRRYLAKVDMDRQLKRYPHECRLLRVYQMTEEEYAAAQQRRAKVQEAQKKKRGIY